MVDKRKRGQDSNKNKVAVVNEDLKSNVEPLSIPKVDEDDKSNVEPLSIPKVDEDDKSNVEPRLVPKVNEDNKSNVEPLLQPRVPITPNMGMGMSMSMLRRQTISNNSASSYEDKRAPQAQGCSYVNYHKPSKPASNVSINLKVVEHEKPDNINWFSMKRGTLLYKLMNAYCERQNKESYKVGFIFDGRRLSPEDTPEELEMKDGDEILAVASMRGS